MYKIYSAIFPAIIIAAFSHSCLETPHLASRRPYVTILVFGGGGDLAQKYTWNALFEIYQLSVKNCGTLPTIKIHSIGRSEYSVGKQKLIKILGKLSISQKELSQVKSTFTDEVEYTQLVTKEHFTDFCSALGSSTDEKKEIGRVHYLAIPPPEYAGVLQKLKKFCHPDDPTWVKVMTEKPFGYDYSSAHQLSQIMLDLYKEEEIFRIDHYVEKTVSKSILDFRAINRNVLEPLWNAAHISDIRIVCHEDDDVRNRLRYYDKAGVIRDVFQNHLVELLLLVTMDVPSSFPNNAPSTLEKAKLRVLQDISNVSIGQVLLGQYETYQTEMKEQLKESKGYSSTPTYAATLLNIHNSVWKSVPIVLVSGKAMPRREAFVEINFKPLNYDFNQKRQNIPPFIKFNINGDIGIFFSKEFKNLKAPSGDWNASEEDDCLAFRPFQDVNPYKNIFSNIISGKGLLQELSTTRMLEMWRIWDQLLSAESNYKLQLYNSKNVQELSFRIDCGNMRLINVVEDENLGFCLNPSTNCEIDSREEKCKVSKFRNQISITCEENDLLTELGHEIYKKAVTAIELRGRFDLAVSGGKTPSKFFNLMGSKYPGFPWKHTHLWIVDERCVSLDDENSNFRLLSQTLLDRILIPRSNVHEMPVGKGDVFCDPDDRGDALYAQEILKQVPDGVLDVCLLGVGADGHTASIFSSDHIFEIKKLITFTFSEGKYGRRMTMAPELLGRFRQLMILITGSSKKDIVNILREMKAPTESLPISLVTLKHLNVQWYIDKKAF